MAVIEDISWRAVRGVPADVSWRREERRVTRSARPELGGTPLHNAWTVVTQTWFAPIAVLVGLFDLLASVAAVVDDKSKMPGQVVGPILMTALAIALFTGLWLRWRSGRTPEARGPAVAAVTGRSVRIGMLAMVLVLALALLVVGVSTGTGTAYFIALGLLVGISVVFGGTVLVRAMRSTDRAHKAGLADALIVAGTLPALALFWMVIPPLLALAVIGGVLGTSPRLRTA